MFLKAVGIVKEKKRKEKYTTQSDYYDLKII